MKLMYVRPGNSLAKNLVMSWASAVVGAYMVMCLFWVVTLFRFSAKVCLWVFGVGALVILGFELALSFYFFHRKRKLRRRIVTHCLEQGFDDEYYRLLEEQLGDLDDRKRLALASDYLEGDRFDGCRQLVQQTDFPHLTAREQEEYFNILLYCAIRQGDRDLANSIYHQARRYFDRATLNSRGHVTHTLGCLCLMNGDADQAEELFLDAWSIRDRALRFDCYIGLGHCSLAKKDWKDAREMAVRASRLARTRFQAQELRTLMLRVEACAKRTHKGEQQ